MYSNADRDLETNILRGARHSSFTFKRSFDVGANRPSVSNTVFGRLERAYPDNIGFYYLILSIVFMSLNAYFTQLAGKELPVPEIICLRSLFMMVGIFVFLTKYSSDLDLSDKKFKKAIIVLCIIGFPTALSYVYGVVNLNLADAITIMISAPIFVSIFSWFIFSQHFKKEQLISIIIWFVGITMVIRPSFFRSTPEEIAEGETPEETLDDQVRLNGVIACLINALLSASSSVVVKATNVRVMPIMLMVYGTLINLVLSGILALINGLVMPSTGTWINLLGIGFLYFYGQFFLMKSLEFASGANAALINNVQIVLIYIIQVAVIQIWPSGWSIAGTILIVVACIIHAAVSR